MYKIERNEEMMMTLIQMQAECDNKLPNSIQKQTSF